VPSHTLPALSGVAVGFRQAPQTGTWKGRIEMQKNKIRGKESSGNVFADLGFPNPERCSPSSSSCQVRKPLSAFSAACWE
jgi:hypothetical protein